MASSIDVQGEGCNISEHVLCEFQGRNKFESGIRFFVEWYYSYTFTNSPNPEELELILSEFFHDKRILRTMTVS